MHPDLIRLLVDKTLKTYVVDANAADPKTFPSTPERLGLNKPLPLQEQQLGDCRLQGGSFHYFKSLRVAIRSFLFYSFIVSPTFDFWPLSSFPKSQLLKV